MSQYYERNNVAHRLRQGYPRVEVLVMHWRQEWFRIISLAAVLTMLLVIMFFSVYLVVSGPEPSAPETDETTYHGPEYAHIQGAAAMAVVPGDGLTTSS